MVVIGLVLLVDLMMVMVRNDRDGVVVWLMKVIVILVTVFWHFEGDGNSGGG